jgi:hypothetical protein
MCPKGNRRMRDNSHFINVIGFYENHKRIGPMLGFKRFDTVAVTISGVELAAKMRKRQFKVGKVPGRPKTIQAIWAAVVAA